MTEDDMQRLDLGDIDAMIKSIERQVELVRLGSAERSDEPNDAASDVTAAVTVVALNRERTSPLCFRENEYRQKTPTQLQAYFETVEQSISRVNSTLKSFNDLSADYAEGQCPGFMVQMLAAAENSLSSVSRPELSDLSYHLETCWPDDDLTEANGAPLDMDQRYARARQGLDQYRRAARSYSQAEAWCNG
ncbi:hypothetical protein [Tateyamaria omphalii]|uniref:Uncharacterized protein n=1 Tax=Tateyamaria omphalii TaxID=299262 RepID=A0A1P8N1T7_9RHOB|nr:hypothetical protein [Tateyamaria omphalii]APX14273.1 hypothetical protein BWR18_20710 [Tateyamaria omphalii]